MPVIYFTFPLQEGIIPICVVEDGEVIGWTSSESMSDVEYSVWDFVEKLQDSSE